MPIYVGVPEEMIPSLRDHKQKEKKSEKQYEQKKRYSLDVMKRCRLDVIRSNQYLRRNFNVRFGHSLAVPVFTQSSESTLAGALTTSGNSLEMGRRNDCV